ncbi:MAG: transcription termination/antitermination protein NusG [Kiritimatiellae bacterium]|nr:transcription termination/antitermination protein NusG [Kiritimatiellia bacterium]
MDKQWFVLHTLSGQEKRVKESIDRRARLEEMGDLVGEVLIPTEKVTESRGEKRATVERKFFPGYVLAHLALYDEPKKINERIWYFIQDTQGVIGFVGGQQPIPLRPSEMDHILKQVEEKKDKVRLKVDYNPGETVSVITGPFQGLQGAIQEVDANHGLLKVMIEIFGAPRLVELEYSQVERVA